MKNKIAIKSSKVFITGGTGSWGHEIVRQLLRKYPEVPEIRILSRNEYKQVEMKREFKNNPKLKFIIGDIRDKDVLNFAMRDIDIVFHLAALKHVNICEENTWEAVLTNIIGTQHVIEASINNSVKKLVNVSTDKAVEPFNLYGVTKACGEKLVINSNFNYTLGSDKTLPDFISIRGGNVVGTNGSVIPLFKEQLRQTNEITITDPSMTRFLMSTREAISLIFTAVENSIGGELFVMRMPATTVDAMSRVMIKLYGDKKSKIKIVGIRPGEKKHEALVSKNETPFTYEFSNKYFVVLPQIYNKDLTERYSKYRKISLQEFTSQNTHQLTDEEFTHMLKKDESYL